MPLATVRRNRTLAGVLVAFMAADALLIGVFVLSRTFTHDTNFGLFGIPLIGVGLVLAWAAYLVIRGARRLTE